MSRVRFLHGFGKHRVFPMETDQENHLNGDNDDRAERDRPPVSAGLRHTCRYARVVRSAIGGTFSLCTRAKTDERLRKYPRLPVRLCPGFERW